MEVVTEPTKYQKSGKAYYEAHKSEILAGEKESKRWLSYYDRNKESRKEISRQAYYDRIGKPMPPLRVKKVTPPKKTPVAPPVATPPVSELERLEALVTELRSLLPGVVKKKARFVLPDEPSQ